MFRGANKLTLDNKGRTVMPTRYRAAIADRSQGRLVITVDRDQCLLIYPTPDWEETERRLMELPNLTDQTRELQRLMVGYATDVDIDGQGRFLVPPELREFAGLKRDTVLIGQGNKFELWDEPRWNERRDAWLNGEKRSEELPEGLGKLQL